MCYDNGPEQNHKCNERIGDAIRTWRKIYNITLPTLATKAGISKGLLSKIENGNGNPTINTLKKIANALGISVEAII